MYSWKEHDAQGYSHRKISPLGSTWYHHVSRVHIPTIIKGKENLQDCQLGRRFMVGRGFQVRVCYTLPKSSKYQGLENGIRVWSVFFRVDKENLAFCEHLARLFPCLWCLVCLKGARLMSVAPGRFWMLTPFHPPFLCNVACSRAIFHQWRQLHYRSLGARTAVGRGSFSAFPLLERSRGVLPRESLQSN